MTTTATATSIKIARPNAMGALSEDTLALVPPTVLPLEDHEILVKVEAMLQDPSDWKYVDFVTHQPIHKTYGRDFSGIVVQAGKGSNAAGVSVGDQVAGFVLANAMHSANYPGHNGNVFFVRMDAELAWVIPRGTFTHKQAAEARLGRRRYISVTIPR